MKEIIIYAIVVVAGLTIFGYSIHMFIGGLVSPETEKLAIIGGCSVAALVMAAAAWDVIRKRRQQGH